MTPIWNITQDGTDQSVVWQDCNTNQRFAIYSGTSNDSSTDLVLDKETGLIWPRNTNVIGKKNWLDSNTLCRELRLGNRIGWRLPTIEELSSLVDTAQSGPALPDGHPFENLPPGHTFWSSTNYENPSAGAWFVNLESGSAGVAGKIVEAYVLPVRGGAGGYNWNW